MVVADIGNPFYTDVLRGLENHVQDRGFHLQLSSTAFLESREDAYLRMLQERAVAGVVWTPSSGSLERLEALRRRGTPVVVVGQPRDGADCCSVSVDDVEGGRVATDHLLSSGHTSIAVVGGSTDLRQVHDRHQGVAAALAEHDGRVLLQTVSTRAGDDDERAGYRAATELATQHDLETPTAVFALNDLLAIGVLRGLTSHGLRVPEDVAVLGYDDIAFAQSATVPLSSVRQPRAELGRRAGELLLAEMHAIDNELSHEHVHVVFAPELVLRRSSAAGG